MTGPRPDPRPDPRPLPDGPLVAFYGDDFTGSSAAMEVLAFAGLPTVLFLQPPTPRRLAAFSGMRAIGIAGTARAQSPAWMDAHLPDAFRLLAGLGAPVAHYKVCSTFDSAPQVGSIGRAAEIAAAVFRPAWTPMVVGDPGMGRYQSFGHLFAMADGVGHRLDRHPTMARHPVTPMDEADLGRHLARQTDRRVGLVDFVAMKRGGTEAQLDAALAAGAEIVSLDVLDRETLTEAGRLIWERAGAPAFGLGSQGFEAALVAYWRAAGLLPAEPDLPRPGPVERIACVSGSVSPVTAGQIAHALDSGFEGLRLDARRVADPAAWEREVARAAEAALAALGAGRDPLIYTAAGPDDPAVAAFREATAGLPAETVNERLGAGLGQALRAVIAGAGLTRAVISGGDTSGRAAAQLGIDALTAIGPLDPGSPLCRADGQDSPLDGLEIALKGGQVGRPDFLQAVKRGGRG
ncbi:four-carbon acid sugar kinase family protein [Methylobacterium sp. NEAU 140]|uniref:four-carbon acid sugar kinase family protein n=1 Tax=Methylobacterium sp. NEAU 140 TaxID=3064945 RepID=UPI00273544CB|nr:four-carbon acid sugar kinase family protein [Methylobacterium sp. NEAU 140]MDP4022977.1 four-carbon acid sugar kinase family protein [Methylobacterium sp. NEAU 140]